MVPDLKTETANISKPDSRPSVPKFTQVVSCMSQQSKCLQNVEQLLEADVICKSRLEYYYAISSSNGHVHKQCRKQCI